jgi:hypothetical protein
MTRTSKPTREEEEQIGCMKHACRGSSFELDWIGSVPSDDPPNRPEVSHNSVPLTTGREERGESSPIVVRLQACFANLLR